MRVDLNCDMGESFGRYRLGHDEAMLDIITSANVACGLHAGDPRVMQETVKAAADREVALGAHPSFPDRQGFGRRWMALTPEEVNAFLIYQMGALAGFAEATGAHLTHVKPHGALYNWAAKDRDTADAIAQAVASFDPALIIVTLPGSTLAEAGRAHGLRVAREGFADRAYQTDGSLVPRSEPGAVIHDPAAAAARAVKMITQGAIEAIDGTVISLDIETLCVHGDTPDAVRIASAVREALDAAGVMVMPLSEMLATS